MPGTVLVVEDEELIADAVEIALRQDGFAVLRAASLQAARGMLVRPIDVIVLDVGLPDGSGIDFCRELQNRSQAAIIFLSARSGEVDRIVGLEVGADDYLAKPFSPRELVARVRALMRRGQRHQAPAMPPAGGLVIDQARTIALLRGVPLELPRLQFRILEVLAGDPGRVFSRSQLMDLAWERPEAAFDRAVDSQMRHLRLALRQAIPQGEPIRTVRGEGYALAEDWPPPT